MTAWGDVVARARGLSTHLLTRRDLASLAEAPDLATLAERLSERSLVPVLATDAAAIERALRRRRADHLALLARWSGTRTAVLAAVFLDEERRSVVRLLRCVAAGWSGPNALTGLTPTPDLSEALLANLAEQRSPGAIAGLLAAWGHPFGPPLLGLDDAIERERAVHRTFAERATAAARRGDGPLRAWVREQIDVENAHQLLVSLEQPAATRDPGAWLAGGARLDAGAFKRILDAATPAEGRRLLRQAFDEPLATALVGEPALAEVAVLPVLVQEQVRTARTAPLTTAPILAYVLRLRAEAVDLRTVVWGVALGLPAATLKSRLVTP